MSYALCPNQTFLFSAIGKGSTFLLICFLYASGQTFFSKTPGRRPPHITGRGVNSVTLGWVGAPKRARPVQIS